MFAIYKKELRSYFINAIGYVYIGVFLAVAAFLCCYTTIGAQSYETTTYFTLLIFSFIILIPLLTMRLFAEEKKLRTEQLLLTAPVSIWGMVLGKYFAAATLFVSSVLVSCVNFIPMYSYAHAEQVADEFVGPATGKIIACLVGIVLIGLAFLAIGMFISSLTENQLAAAVVTIVIILIMIVLDILQPYVNIYALRFVMDWVCVLSRFTSFTQGILDYSAILYYLSITGVFLLLTVRVYDKRRWG
jgi:ABC-2 type transport system permease protein